MRVLRAPELLCSAQSHAQPQPAAKREAMKHAVLVSMRALPAQTYIVLSWQHMALHRLAMQMGTGSGRLMAYRLQPGQATQAREGSRAAHPKLTAGSLQAHPLLQQALQQLAADQACCHAGLLGCH